MALAAAPPPPLATFDQDLEARKKTSSCTLQSSAIPHLPQATTSALQQQSAATSLRLDRRTPEASKIKMSSPRLLNPQCSLCSAHLSRSPPRRKNSYHVSAGARASNRQLKATNAIASVLSFFKITGPHCTSEGGDSVACGRGDRWQGYGSNSKPPKQHVFRDGELLHRSSSGERGCVSCAAKSVASLHSCQAGHGKWAAHSQLQAMEH